jgi:hypothetical protein
VPIAVHSPHCRRFRNKFLRYQFVIGWDAPTGEFENETPTTDFGSDGYRLADGIRAVGRVPTV